MGKLIFAILINLFFLGSTPALARSTLIVEELLETHPAILAIDRDDVSSLQLWLSSGHAPLAKVKNKFHERLIERAALHGSFQCFESLLHSIHQMHAESELKDGRGTPLLVSLSSLAVPGKDKTSIYERMIALIISISPELVQEKDRAYIGDGRTALHEAAAVGNLKIMQLLLLRGAQINAKTSTGETPLHFAARFDHLDAVKYLVTSGAQINERSRFTRTTPLMAAAEMGNEKVIRMLMMSGAERDARDVFGKTAPERFREYRLASYVSTNRKKTYR